MVVENGFAVRFEDGLGGHCEYWGFSKYRLRSISSCIHNCDPNIWRHSLTHLLSLFKLRALQYCELQDTGIMCLWSVLNIGSSRRGLLNCSN